VSDLLPFEQLERLAQQQLTAVRGGDLEGFDRLSVERDHVTALLVPPVSAALRQQARLILAGVQIVDAAITESLQRDLAATRAEKATLRHGHTALKGYSGHQQKYSLSISG
jgi:hypothetical protein